MSWTTQNPLIQIVQRAFELQLRMHRLNLIKKFQNAEAQARAAGYPTDKLVAARLSLARAQLVPSKSEFDLAPVLRDPNAPLRHLRVTGGRRDF